MIELLDARLRAMREEAKIGRDPTAADAVLEHLLNTAHAIGAKRVLEIGAAEGLTSLALMLTTDARITAIELDATRAATARKNYSAFGTESRVNLIEGDAAQVLPALEEDGAYDLIFLDGPKVQYRRYFADCKRLLRKGGYLFSDDVLLFGYVTGEPPKKRRALAEHMREYLAILGDDKDFKTEVLQIGEGLAVSLKL